MSIKKLVGETAIYGISSIGGRLLAFLLVPLYTGVLKEVFSTGEYGIVTHLFSMIGLSMIFFTYRMELAYFRFGTENKKQEHAAFNAAGLSTIILTAVLASILLLFSNQLASLLGYEELGYLVRLALGIIVVDALCEIPYAKLRLEQKPVRFAVIRLTGTILNLGLNVFFILFCPYALAHESWSFLHPFINSIYSEEYLIAYVFISNLIGNGIALLLLSPTLFRIKIKDFEPDLWRKMSKYALPLVVVGISFIFNELFDRFIMPYWLSGTTEENLAQVGIYGACYKLTMFLTLFTQAFRYGAEPFFFRQKTAANAKETYARVAKYFSLIGTIGFLSVLLYLDIVKQIIGNEFQAGIRVVPILLLANLFLGIYYNFSVWYKLIDETKWGAYISLVGLTITISMNYFLLAKFGYIAAAWTTFTCYFVMMSLAYFLGQRKYPIPYPILRMASYIILAVAAYFLSGWLNDLLVIEYPINLIINSLVLIVYLVAIYYMERKEVKMIFAR